MSKFLSLLFIFTAFVVPESHAAESPWAIADQVRARLVGGPGTEAALEVELAEGWHSYWRAPGDAGLPPQFDWVKSENVASVDVSWPYPQRFDEMGMTTFGYLGTVTFPLLAHSKTEGEKTRLNLALNIMVCKDICIPQMLEISLDLDGAPGSGAGVLDLAKRRIPRTDNPSLVIDTVVAGPDALVLTVFSKRGFAGADAFAFMGDKAYTKKPEIMVDEKDPEKAIISIPKSSGGQGVLAGLMEGGDLNVVVVVEGHAAEKIVKF